MSINCRFARDTVSVRTDGTVAPCCISLPIKNKDGSVFTVKNTTAHSAYHSSEFQKIRQNLREGVRDSHCVNCWTAEDQGTASLRILHQNDDTEEQLQQLDLALSNACNLKCRSCNATDSSLWVRDQYQLEGSRGSYRDFRQQYIFNVKPQDQFYEAMLSKGLDQIQQLSFYGGEPMLHPTTWKILQRVVELGRAADVSLSFNTNCTVYPERYMALLSQFKSVFLAVSLDSSSAEQFNYIRYPADFHQVTSVLDKFCDWSQQSGDRSVKIAHTVSNYNVFYIKDMLDWSGQKGLGIALNPVNYPQHLCIQHLPQGIKSKVLKGLDHATAELMQQWMGDQGSRESWQEFLQSVLKLDRLRQQSFVAVFPEYYQAIRSLHP
jgi:sulfatase maturation enzyme AslB (radical SAM superfamily)